MKLELNEYSPYLRKSLRYIQNLFDGLIEVEVTKLNNDNERCWIEFNCEYGVFNLSDDCDNLDVFSTKRYLQIFEILENQIKEFVGELIEL